MKILKAIIQLSILSSLSLLLGCKSSKPVSTNSEIPFQIHEAYSKTWVAGVKQGGSGIEYTFEIELGEIEKINFGEIWVNNQKLSSKIVKDNKIVQDQNLLLTNDHVKLRCSGERTVDATIKTPIPLEEGQAIISYSLAGNTTQYLLVETIELRKSENRK